MFEQKMLLILCRSEKRLPFYAGARDAPYFLSEQKMLRNYSLIQLSLLLTVSHIRAVLSVAVDATMWAEFNGNRTQVMSPPCPTS